MFTEQDYKIEINANVTWRKFQSPENLEKLLGRLVSAQAVPSQTTIDRFLARSKFPRTDGGNAASDAEKQRAESRAQWDVAVKEVRDVPLTRNELEEFASLSPAELQRRYFENSADGRYFQIRYNLACDRHGYRRPSPPTLSPQAAAAAVPKGQELVISLEEYRSTPARIVARKCLRDPRYLAAINKLAAEGKI